jgi:hypothetical protein
MYLIRTINGSKISCCPLSTRDDIEALRENKSVRLIGIKFYSNGRAKRSKIKVDFKGKVPDVPDDY